MQPVSRRSLIARSPLWAILPLVGAFACTPAAVSVNVQLVTQMCGSPSQSFPYGGDYIQITVYGPGVNSANLRTLYAVSSDSVSMPAIPVGSARNIVVEVEDSTNAFAVVAHGETGPVDITGKSQSLNLTIFMRPVNEFSPANGASNPTTCTQLAQDRVAHTATTLDNGQVLIAGGYSVSGTNVSYLDSTEIYDPQTGLTTAGPSMSTARAYAAAVHLPGTKYTIVIGGEDSVAGNPNGGALGTGEIYDEDAQQFVGVATLAGNAMKNGITRAAAAVPLPLSGGGQPGTVLIFGGNDYTGTPQSEILTYDTNDGFLDTGLTMVSGRSEAAAVPIPGGVLLVGGLSGSSGSMTTPMDVSGMTSPDNSHYSPFANAVTLSSGHIFPIAGSLTDGSILILDGLSSVSQSEGGLGSATNVMDWLSPSYDNTMVAPQPSPALPTRGWGGGLSLPDGTMLAAGGGDVNGSNATALTSGTVLFLHNGGVSSLPVGNAMQDGRIGAAYTLLQDGSVLITGGYKYNSSGVEQSVTSIDVYQPAYQTDTTTAHVLRQ